MTTTTLAISDYLENAWLEWVMRGGTFTAPSNVYLALFTSNPADDDSGSEVSSGFGYTARPELSFGAPSGGTISQDTAINFAASGGSWGDVTHIGIYDSATIGAGNLLAYGALDQAYTMADGAELDFAIGDIDIVLPTTQITTVLAGYLLGHTFEAGTTVGLGSLYFALFGSDPGNAGALTSELSGNAYARQTISSVFGAPSGGVCSNPAPLLFPEPTPSDWSSASYIGVCSASSGGQCLWRAPLSSAAVITTGQRLRLAAGQLTAQVR